MKIEETKETRSIFQYRIHLCLTSIPFGRNICTSNEAMESPSRYLLPDRDGAGPLQDLEYCRIAATLHVQFQVNLLS